MADNKENGSHAHVNMNETETTEHLNSLENHQQSGQVPVEESEREITQTDHLNKRLLDSFLQRLNQVNSGLPAVQRIDTADPEEDMDFDQSNQISHHN